MTQNKTINDNILEWLKKKGFPFELKCARTLVEHGFRIQHSVHYMDQEAQNYREIDLIAFKSFPIDDFYFNLTIVIECKTSDVPWIVFSNNPGYSQSDLLRNMLISDNGKSLLSGLDVNDTNSFTFSLLKEELVGFNFVQMRENNKDKDHAYEALIQSSKASTALVQQSNESKFKFCNVYIPIVIVDKNLFSVFDEQENFELQTEEIKYCKFGKRYAFDERLLIMHHLVSGTHLNEYCKLLSNDFDNFFKKYLDQIKYIAKNNPINSTEGKYSIF